MSTTKLAEPDLQQFVVELDMITQMVEKNLPNLQVQCRKVNDLLRQQPELAYMLSEEQIGQFMRGVIHEAQVQFSVASTAGRGDARGKNPLKGVNLTELGRHEEVQI